MCGARATVVDHIVAQRFGGGEQQANLQALCSRCHSAKTQDEARLGKQAKTMSADELKAAVEALVDRWT
jgi:5-methylcytosine-specific restriction endonuclease McrA